MTISPVPEQWAQPSELNLQELLDVLQRRKGTFLQVFLLVLAAGVVAATLGKPVYVTQAKLLVPSGTPTVSIIDSNNPIAALMAAMQVDSISTQLQDLQSGEFLNRVRKQAHIVSRPEEIPPSVRFEALPDSNIIQVTVEGGDPREIASLANGVVDLHRQEADDKATGGITITKEFVEQELKRQQTKLDEAEHHLSHFRQANQVPERTSERDARAGEYTALLARVIETESNLTAARAQIKDLQARLERGPRELVQESVKENPRIARLQAKLDELDFQRMDLLREYTPMSRPVRDLDQQVLRLKQQFAAEPKEIHGLTRSVNPARGILQARLDELMATLHGYEENHNAALAQFTAKKGLLVNQETWESDLGKLTRDRDAIQAACTMLSDRLRDLEIRSHARLTPPARIVEYAAVPTVPIRPRKSMNVALSAILALLLAAGTVLLQEYLDDRVNAPEEVERLAGLPTLAHVPLMPQDQPRVLTSLSAHSPAVEAYRALRSGIGFAGIDAPVRRLQVTSASKGDGKSTTSTNLAIAMARDGKKVLLIDADLRSPTVHRLLGVASSPGLSEVLTGMSTLEAALQTSEVADLQVIAAGTIPPNPAELLGSAAFDRLLGQLEAHADVVIFDSPPCVPVTDPLILASRMDAVVLVLKMGQTRKGAIKQTMELLGRARARVIGAVFNQVEPNRRGYYYYRQYNEYGYGQGSSSDTGRPEAAQRRNGKTANSLLEQPRAVAGPTRDADGDG
jgi:capsular exopolysaccharide synthesis family protein